ncbi:MAG: glycosyltransferase family 4 protein [Bacteroidia bacterium]|nr:glycosyltransferase family 4 protein [Bacteroidia bacterium]MDW8235446.1 glycosyltransferase family 4 protein [Bacteroidia bacterium]
MFHLLRFTLWSAYILWRLRRRKIYLIATVPPPFLPIVATLHKKLTGKPFAVELYDGWPALLLGLPGKARFIGYLLMPIMRWSYREAHIRVALSPGIASLFPELSFHLSYNGTRPEVFRRRGTAPFLPFRIIYAGTLGWVNHLRFLLQVAHLLQEWAGIEFWIIGEGSESALLRQAAHSLKRVHFFHPVPVEEVPYWLSQAHIGVSLTRPIPVLATNSANKFYDYLACGLVVGLNYGSWQAEVLEQEGCGFSAATPEDFAKNILKYYWGREEWMRASARARLLAERKYDRRHLAQAFLHLLYS